VEDVVGGELRRLGGDGAVAAMQTLMVVVRAGARESG